MKQYTVRITILYDNTAFVSGLKAHWGFSCLVERTGSPVVLFDTGFSGSTLIGNMSILGIDPDETDIVFISHPHRDHTGGLEMLLEYNSHAKIAAPHSFSFTGSREVMVVTDPVEICEGIYSTGELEHFEQSMVIDTPEGLVVITGCSHPGIRTILEAAGEYGSVYALIGGFHGFSELDLLEDITFVCPTHCTTFLKRIWNRFPGKCIEGGAGKVIEI